MSENNKVDVGGLTGTLFADAWKALMGTVALKISWCKQKGMPLSELQPEQLVESAVAAGANLEAKFARQLVDALNRQSVATWRLDPDLEASRQGPDTVIRAQFPDRFLVLLARELGGETSTIGTAASGLMSQTSHHGCVVSRFET